MQNSLFDESKKSAFNNLFVKNIPASAAAPVGWEGLLSHDRLFQSRPAETQLFSAAGPPPPLSAVTGICRDDVSLQGMRAERSILIQVTYQSFTFHSKIVFFFFFLNEPDAYCPPRVEWRNMMLS